MAIMSMSAVWLLAACSAEAPTLASTATPTSLSTLAPASATPAPASSPTPHAFVGGYRAYDVSEDPIPAVLAFVKLELAKTNPDVTITGVRQAEVQVVGRRQLPPHLPLHPWHSLGNPRRDGLPALGRGRPIPADQT